MSFANRSASRTVPSVDPSSTTITSKSRSVWSRTDPSTAPMCDSALKAGMTTVTDGTLSLLPTASLCQRRRCRLLDAFTRHGPYPIASVHHVQSHAVAVTLAVETERTRIHGAAVRRHDLDDRLHRGAHCRTVDEQG